MRFMKLAAIGCLLLSANLHAQSFQPPTAFTAPGTLVVDTSSTATIVVQATGSGTNISFAMQGLPNGSSTWVQLPMAVPASCHVTFAASNNGAWIVSVAGYSQAQMNLTAISGGTETFGLTNSSAPADLSSCTTSNGTPVALDATSLSGTAATTVLTSGHATFGGWVSATVPYCINYVGTAGSVNNSPVGTSCFPANQAFVLPHTNNGISIYGLSAGSAYGTGQS